MTYQDLITVTQEANRLLDRVQELTTAQPRCKGMPESTSIDPGKLTAAVRRASMDLTRVLVDLRK